MPLGPRFTQIKNISALFILFVLDCSAYINLVRYGLRVLFPLLHCLARFLEVDGREDQSTGAHSFPLATMSNDLRSTFIYLLLVVLGRHVLLPQRHDLIRKGAIELMRLYPAMVARMRYWYGGHVVVLENPNAPRQRPLPFMNLAHVLGEEPAHHGPRVVRRFRDNAGGIEHAPNGVRTATQPQWKKSVHKRRTFMWNTTTEIAEAAQQVWRQVPGEGLELVEEIDEDHLTCSICWGPYAVGDNVAILPCEHWFHDGCLEMWFKDHFSCPKCTKELEWVLAIKK